MIDDVQEPNVPKIHSSHSGIKHLIYRFIRFPLLFLPPPPLLSDNECSFATDHQPYAPAASSSYHVLPLPWKERRSLLISWYPEAPLSPFLACEAFVVDPQVLEPPGSPFLRSPHALGSALVFTWLLLGSNGSFLSPTNVSLWPSVLELY